MSCLLWSRHHGSMGRQSLFMRSRARHESGYLRRYPRVHPWENPCKRITCVRVTRRLQNPRVWVSVLDHTQPVQVTRTTRGKHSHATTTTRRCLAHARHPHHCCHPRLCPHPCPSPSPRLSPSPPSPSSPSPTPVTLAFALATFALALALALA